MKFAHLAVAFSLFLTVAQADDAVFTAVLQESVHDGAVRYQTFVQGSKVREIRAATVRNQPGFYCKPRSHASVLDQRISRWLYPL